MSSFYVNQPSLGARIGTGLAQGFSQQIPKEIERYRLAKGLQNFSNQSANMNPLQQLASLASIPGAAQNPQLLQTFGDLARMQSYKQALEGRNQERTTGEMYRPQGAQKGKGEAGKAPSLEKRSHLEEILEPPILPTQDEILNEAENIYPDIWNRNPQEAINLVNQKYQQQQARYQSNLQAQQHLTGLEREIKNDLNKQSENLEAKIPGDVYDKIESQAINAIKSKKDGGEGLTREEALKKYGKELDNISRQYSNAANLGNWSLMTQSSRAIETNLNSIQKEFAKRGDQRNLADTLVANSKISPQLAYSVADPVKDYKEVNDYLKKIPELNKNLPKGGIPGILPNLESFTLPHREKETQRIIPQLASLISKGNGSPLAIAEELENKGYDPQLWLKYLDDHSTELNLTSQQIEQLGKRQPFLGRLNDIFFKSFSGTK